MDTTTLPTKDELEARWRYRIIRSDSKFQKTTIAAWLPLNEARKIASLLDRQSVVESNGAFGRDSYFIDRHHPSPIKQGHVATGDLIIHQVMEPIGSFSLSASYSYRLFFLVAEVTLADKFGRVLSYRDRKGDHAGSPKTFWTLSSTEIYVPLVMLGLAEREKELEHWGVEFGSIRDASSWLNVYQVHEEPVYPEGFSGTFSAPAAARPAPDETFPNAPRAGWNNSAIT